MLILAFEVNCATALIALFFHFYILQCAISTMILPKKPSNFAGKIQNIIIYVRKMKKVVLSRLDFAQYFL